MAISPLCPSAYQLEIISAMIRSMYCSINKLSIVAFREFDIIAIIISKEQQTEYRVQQHSIYSTCSY